MLKEEIYALSTDPIYIGTGGYTIGRVDNTIVRDPITKIPKIPGSSLAGTWRYYTTLKLYSYFKDDYKAFRKKRESVDIKDLFITTSPDWVINYEDNRYAAVKCAGQDDAPERDVEGDTIYENGKIGHCGRCIVCNSFGYSKNNMSKHGRVYFSDLNILFFPVHTRLGVKWITSPQILLSANIDIRRKEGGYRSNFGEDEVKFIKTDIEDKSEKEYLTGYINLGWLNLKISDSFENIDISKICIDAQFKEVISDNLILVSDKIISQIINSNLEVRTSVSIDPLTGTAKPGALFTSEAIPRGTVFYGNLRITDEIKINNEDNKEKKELKAEMIYEALKESSVYYESLGIGGMVTRGFGRMKVFLPDLDNKQKGDNDVDAE